MNLVTLYNKKTVWSLVKKIDVVKRNSYKSNSFLYTYLEFSNKEYAVQIYFDISNIDSLVLLKAIPNKIKELNFNYRNYSVYLRGCEITWSREAKDMAVIEMYADEAQLLPKR